MAEAATTSTTPKSFDPVLGRVPSGVFILTIGTGARSTGMLTSWVMQAAFEPPMVSVAVKLGRYVCDWLTAGEPFVLNLVGESQKQFLKHFGKGFEPGSPDTVRKLGRASQSRLLVSLSESGLRRV